jgi:hypothetical protein
MMLQHWYGFPVVVSEFLKNKAMSEEKKGGLGPKFKLILDARTTIYVKTKEALTSWIEKFPKAQVVELY